MRLTVLGSSASCAGAGEACSGHLVEGGGARVLFDCGNGVIANLASVADPLTLDAVFVTHEHPDHFVDVYALQALLRFAPEGPAAPLALYLPPGLFERMRCLLSERGATDLAEAFLVHELAEEIPLAISGLTVTPHRVDHVDPTFALVAEADGARLVYTSDTAPGTSVFAAARDADLLLAEATLPERYAGAAPHMTPRQAGELARDVRAGELVLVHIWPTNDREQTAQEAAEYFGGRVTVAHELDAFDIVPRSGGPL